MATKKNEENLSALIWEDVQVPLLGKKREHRSIQNARSRALFSFARLDHNVGIRFAISTWMEV